MRLNTPFILPPVVSRAAQGFFLTIALMGGVSFASGQGGASSLSGAPAGVSTPPWADWIERDFPFYSAMVYAERAEPVLLANNRTPRGLVLNLGGDVWACFDLDLLRVAAVWEGEEAKTYSNAAYSYFGAWPSQRERSARAPLAHDAVWFANGLYPGWQLGTAPTLRDPRAPAPDPAEIGRGPLAEEHGRFRAVRLTPGGPRLEYNVADASVEERISRVDGSRSRTIERRIRITGTRQPLVLVLAVKPAKPANADEAMAQPRITVSPETETGEACCVELIDHADVWAVRVSPRARPVDFSVTMTCGAGAALAPQPDPGHEPAGRRARVVAKGDDSPATARWPQELTTSAVLSTEPAAYVVDYIPLPLENPWRRNVRVADVQFFSDGTAAALTFDGDVWMVRGLNGDLNAVRWRRFASGLHEPLSMVVREGEIFVFDRNGIWRLRDTDGNGEADVHELFSNAFAQTFTLNEYSNTMKLAPDGSFIIAKKSATRVVDGPGNGTVLRLSPDGSTSTVLGWGFRQPFIGVDPLTGMVTASDQEGNYVPATPLYLVRGGTYHGFLGPTAPKEAYPAPIDEPLTWMPRTGSASGVTQVWLRNAKMGPLNDSLIYASYNRPELFVVRLNERHSQPQAAVISLTQNFDFSLIGATVNPADGQLYVAGFKIYGSGAKRISGLARVRYTGGPCTVPREVVPMQEGVLLRFDVELAANAAADLANYSVERWNYRRTAAYGSPHYKLDGSKGQDRMYPSSVYLSKDRKSVFLGLPEMRSDVMQMQVGWRLAMAAGTRFENRAHLTPFVLGAFVPVAEGFDDVRVDLTPRRPADPAAKVVASPAEGERLYQAIGCMACHTTNGAAQLGPTWRGLFGSRRKFTDESSATADEAYLRESILEPAVRVVPGFEAPMPSYAGLLDDGQIESLVMYIKTLQ